MPELKLYSEREQEVQQQGGLNWGLSNGHVNEGDAYIALTKGFFRDNLYFFPSHGSEIWIEWDDEVKMLCLLEGTQFINGSIYPKQISTLGDKSILGKYLRKRLGVGMNQCITRLDLQVYGRETIFVTYLGDNKYKFDFSI